MKVLMFVTLFMSFVTYAKEQVITFSSDGFYYKLISSNEVIKLKGSLINISFTKQKCNEKLLRSFNYSLSQKLKKKSVSEKDYFSVNINGLNFKLSRKSQLGRFLFAMPETIKRNKDKEVYLCRKRKS